MPEAVIRRRFKAGLHYFESLYKPLVNDWMLFDNSGESPEMVAWEENTL